MKEEKTIIDLKFQSTLSTRELRTLIENRKKKLIHTEGLISLFCNSNETTNTVEGTYIFQNIQFAEKYLEDFLIKGIGPKYGAIPRTLRIKISSSDHRI